MKIEIGKFIFEFQNSSTGSCSPWHTAVAREMGIKLWGTCDMGHFVKINSDIYKIPGTREDSRLKKEVQVLSELVNSGCLTENEIEEEVKNILSGLIPQESLLDFKNRINKNAGEDGN